MGPHSHVDDPLYTETNVTWRGVELCVQSMADQDGGHLTWLATPNTSSTDLQLVLVPWYLGEPSAGWARGGALEIDTSAGTISAVTAGLRGTVVTATAASIDGLSGSGACGDLALEGSGCLALSLEEPVSIDAKSLTDTTDDINAQPPNLAAARIAVEAAREAEINRYGVWGSDEMAEAYEAMHTVTTWLTAWQPFEGVIRCMHTGGGVGAGRGGSAPRTLRFALTALQPPPSTPTSHTSHVAPHTSHLTPPCDPNIARRACGITGRHLPITRSSNGTRTSRRTC